ncbi:hypothetical protein Celaphus_00015944 [Cervus elaphus hippelaphus]|uniref:Uncharacterized protein n=1 Tax=Cervus elaphus hippelaphus TaxID=46360 RepID=A0A212C1I0_CEREH|nr:hypothetical protein Celaphus_00015944 [Cervus elaphus hippelaphus]
MGFFFIPWYKTILVASGEKRDRVTGIQTSAHQLVCDSAVLHDREVLADSGHSPACVWFPGAGCRPVTRGLSSGPGRGPLAV